MDYKEKRDLIYRPLQQQGVFSWDFMYGQEYALASCHTIAKADRAEISCATEKLGSIFAKTVLVLQQGTDDLLIELGIPCQAISALRVPVLPQFSTLIGRFDFARTPGGLKLLEFNSDTPSGIVEAFYVNSKVCSFYGFNDPNADRLGDITNAFRQMLGSYQELGYKTDSIVFSALDWHVEDAGTTRFLLANSGLNADFVPLRDLRIYQDRLCAVIKGELAPIDIWCRIHPLEILSEEQDEDGYPTGAHVLDLIARKKLAVINPPVALLSQTKALQALIWSLHEQNVFFTADEQAAIAAYMLPTYFENKFLGKCPYVVKPVLGREGGSVTIHDLNGRVMQADSGDQYRGQGVIFQEFVELEKVVVETLQGFYSGRLLWGSFLIGGKASAINARLGERITNDMAFYLPIRLD